MLKAVNIEVLELSDPKGAIGTFKVVDELEALHDTPAPTL